MKANFLNTNKLHKFFHWEFWPSFMFYVPNIPYGIYLAIKAKNLVFFSAANPSIKSSGNGTESKFETLQLIPDEFKPKSVLHLKDENFQKTIKNIQNENIQFPLIVKPDIGFRGLLVKKISTEIELKNYLSTYYIDFIIQEFIDFKHECGIFYSRNPKEEKGSISSITLKKFLTVLGDGNATLKELVEANERTNLYKELIFETHQEKLTIVLAENEELQLSVIGNHCKGTQFINGNHLISRKLTESFDRLSPKILGVFYGRIDLKYNDFSDLENGFNFKILEINGIISEPTHIYDATNSSYFDALKSIRTHWKTLFEISTTNHKEFGIPYKSFEVFFQEMAELRKYSKKISKLTRKN